MMETQNQRYEKDLQRLKEFRLLDDEFFTKCFEGNNEAVELILKIILNKKDLKVKEVRTQVFVENLLKRSVRLDILALDHEDVLYNIEIQRADKGAGRKRARYNSSMLDVNLLEKGEDFHRLPETFVIFITENDVMKKGKPIYQVERCFLDTGERFEDGSHILYVNGAYRGSNEIGMLMHDLSCTDPSDMYFDVLAERVRFFKESKEGTMIMSKLMEEIVMEEIKERMRVTAQKMILTGKYAMDEIMMISGLSHEEVEEIQLEMKMTF